MGAMLLFAFAVFVIQIVWSSSRSEALDDDTDTDIGMRIIERESEDRLQMLLSNRESRELATKRDGGGSSLSSGKFNSEQDEDKEIACDIKKWPSLNLFLPIGPKPHNSRIHEYDTLFLRSALLFWPWKQSNSSLIIMADGELALAEGAEYVNMLTKLYVEGHLCMP